MFADIVGYTALLGEDEQNAFELLKRNRSVQRPIIEKFNGRWLKEIGDGVLASFTTVSEAVYCAKAIQEACLKENDLKLRIGIHLGEVVLIILLLSYLLYSNFTAKQPLTDAPPEITDKSIAVLPFKDDSEGSDNQYFCDGMMDEILNHLQKIAELGVKSRTAVEPYRNSTLSFATIAQELNVAFVLEGAVRKYGDRFRITTQLIEVSSGNHLWSETYDGIFSDTIFVVQSNIAKKIASSLDAVIAPDEEEKIDRIPTANIAAYDLYVSARHERQLYWNTFDEKHLKSSHEMLDRGVENIIGLQMPLVLLEIMKKLKHIAR